MSEVSTSTTINPRIIQLGDQRISLDPSQTNDGSQLDIVTSRNDPQNMEALERIASDWAIQIHRAQRTCEVERGSNEVTCSTNMPLATLAGMMPDLVDRITRELGSGTDSGRAVGAGASGGNTGGGYERDGVELTST